MQKHSFWNRFLLAINILNQLLLFGVRLHSSLALLLHLSLSLHRIWRERSLLMSSDRKSSPPTARLSRPSARLWPGLLMDRYESLCARRGYFAAHQFGCWISGCHCVWVQWIVFNRNQWTNNKVILITLFFFSDSLCWIHRQPDQSLAGDRRDPIKM